jgi:cytosine/adenosine deaminase-related metal-dependent hydrolase
MGSKGRSTSLRALEPGRYALCSKEATVSPELSSAIQAAASVVTVIIALLALKQVQLLRMQIKTDHERSRRHRAVEDLNDWNSHLTEGITSARRLVETFSPEQLEAVNRLVRNSAPVSGRGF